MIAGKEKCPGLSGIQSDTVSLCSAVAGRNALLLTEKTFNEGKNIQGNRKCHLCPKQKRIIMTGM
jgi:hypothetical protein